MTLFCLRDTFSQNSSLPYLSDPDFPCDENPNYLPDVTGWSASPLNSTGNRNYSFEFFERLKTNFFYFLLCNMKPKAIITQTMFSTYPKAPMENYITRVASKIDWIFNLENFKILKTFIYREYRRKDLMFQEPKSGRCPGPRIFAPAVRAPHAKCVVVSSHFQPIRRQLLVTFMLSFRHLRRHA